MKFVYAIAAFTCSSLALGCGDGDSPTFPATSDAAGTGGASTSSGGSPTSSGTGGDPSSTSSSSGTGSAGGAGGGAAVNDPDQDGPYAFVELDDTTTVAATGDEVPIHCVYPTGGPTEGPYPVVVVAHGFQLPPTQYYSYLRRLASFGYVALTADYPAGFTGVSNVDAARDVLGALDWAAQRAELAGKADVELAGLTGHSMGGKVSLLAATMDTRVKATITLDPVDASMSCDPQDCPDVSDMMPIAIPTGFLGETIDSSGGFQACAPAADNYTTYYAGTTSPSLEVTVLGANHMSFLDDVGSCGFVCGFCNAATAPDGVVNALARAYVVAFYERYLRGNAGYDTYLTGAEAEARYVGTGLATIQSK
jgi:chlorophyllase